MAARRVHLGAEYDEALRKCLLAVLRELRAVHCDHRWGVGGSQEVQEAIFDVDGKRLVVCAETYVGLTIEGDAELVEGIRSRMTNES
ncbi:MAG: hypothetical protein JNM84_18415 [Planctomycetes bacterium]|nr:hypothetical protein [Planctomycetota bacterium]